MVNTKVNMKVYIGLGALQAFIGLGALAGGFGLIRDPSGSALGLPMSFYYNQIILPSTCAN